MRKLNTLLAVAGLAAALPVGATTVELPSIVTGGQTTVLFGNHALADLGLKLLGGSEAVQIPGFLGPNSAGFNINSRDAAAPLLPTTFQYDSNDLVPFSGTIEHEGSLFLTDLATESADIEVGNFTIAFDGARVSEASGASGFYVASTIGAEAILFDIANVIVETFPMMLVIAADIIVSPEFSALLNALELVAGDVTGADAGLAVVYASAEVVPVPAAVWLFGSALGLLGWVRRRA